MALKTVDPIAIFDDLPRAPFAGSQDFRRRRQARHIVVPVTDYHRWSEMGDVVILQSGGGQDDRIVANLFFRALHHRRPQRFADELRSETNP